MKTKRKIIGKREAGKLNTCTGGGKRNPGSKKKKLFSKCTEKVLAGASFSNSPYQYVYPQKLATALGFEDF